MTFCRGKSRIVQVCFHRNLEFGPGVSRHKVTVQCSQEYYHQVGILMDFEPFYLCSVPNLIQSERSQKSKDKQIEYLTGKNTDTCKLTRNCWIFISLKKMVSLLVYSNFIIVSLSDCTKNVLLIDLESTARYTVDFFHVIHEFIF